MYQIFITFTLCNSVSRKLWIITSYVPIHYEDAIHYSQPSNCHPVIFHLVLTERGQLAPQLQEGNPLTNCAAQYMRKTNSINLTHQIRLGSILKLLFTDRDIVRPIITSISS